MPENEYYWVANEIFKKNTIKKPVILKARVTPTEEIIKGAALVGKEYESLYQIPDSKSQVPNSYKVLAADFVNTEEGTGLDSPCSGFRGRRHENRQRKQSSHPDNRGRRRQGKTRHNRRGIIR